MKKRILILALSSLVCASSAFASGWRIPEQSVNSTALSAAYVANASGADASYFNPANMVFDPEKDRYQFEFDLNYIHLTAVEYEDNRIPTMDAESEKENFYIPLFHLVSPEYKDLRFGLSLTTPAGLSKRWEDSWAQIKAEEFTLEVFELNPTIAYKITDWLSIGGGARAIYSKGKVQSSTRPTDPADASRNLKGNSIDFGYNLAMSVKPIESLTTSITWRSRVDLNLDGNGTRLYYNDLTYNNLTYYGHGDVSVPVPEVLTIAASYTIQSTTIEFTWDRTYWSAYDELDFNYDSGIHPVLDSIYGSPIEKNYNDTDAFRIGLTQKLLDDKLTLMFGFAIDETPVPVQTLGFELPDSDAKLYSCGFRYKLDDTYEVGMSFLYDQKETLKVSNNDNTIDGEFSNSSAYMVTTGIMVKF
ncbi:MAG: outer membrane protein transport protein [Desulfobulbaceae bacterium]|jgi:long-chain fatty acid transport protein|nr:outer membrane protein transport protein [Desulfobulbaceae bacterium]